MFPFPDPGLQSEPAGDRAWWAGVFVIIPVSTHWVVLKGGRLECWGYNRQWSWPECEPGTTREDWKLR